MSGVFILINSLSDFPLVFSLHLLVGLIFPRSLFLASICPRSSFSRPASLVTSLTFGLKQPRDTCKGYMHVQWLLAFYTTTFLFSSGGVGVLGWRSDCLVPYLSQCGVMRTKCRKTKLCLCVIFYFFYFALISLVFTSSEMLWAYLWRWNK